MKLSRIAILACLLDQLPLRHVPVSCGSHKVAHAHSDPKYGYLTASAAYICRVIEWAGITGESNLN